MNCSHTHRRDEDSPSVFCHTLNLFYGVATFSWSGTKLLLFWLARLKSYGFPTCRGYDDMEGIIRDASVFPNSHGEDFLPGKSQILTFAEVLWVKQVRGDRTLLRQIVHFAGSVFNRAAFVRSMKQWGWMDPVLAWIPVLCLQWLSSDFVSALEVFKMHCLLLCIEVDETCVSVWVSVCVSVCMSGYL